MKFSIFAVLASTWLALTWPTSALALEGEPYIHDPSTVTFSNGKYYSFGTGGGGLISSDGWTWHSGAVRPGGGAAPDVLKIGDRFLIVYGATGGGLGGGHNGRILTMWNQTLDPTSPDFKFSEPVVVASSNGEEDCDAIDPSLLLDPNDGRLWLTYGTYFGFIRLAELDPKTGKRVEGNTAVNIAIDCEATYLMYRDGWYYLLGTHGTCCSGPNSTYNIRVGRSRKITGPYLDNMGMDMLRGGGKLVVAASGRFIGPGHFGLMDLGDGVQKFSCHYEADLDHGGRSVLDIRPLLWKDEWPVAGDNFSGGIFVIQSERSGYALELAVDTIPMPQIRRRWPGGPGGPPRTTRAGTPPPTPAPLPPEPTPGPVALQDIANVSKAWPTGNIEVRLGDYIIRPHQKWTITPVAEGGGYLGSPYFKITVTGTDRALAATADLELTTVASFTGAPEQLWRIDQLTDGTYRIMPKEMPNAKGDYALTAVGASTISLAKFENHDDKARWSFRLP
jgi:arabinan endo-1,5-alpha-L-arabinosidase